jgi:histidyl-tRNA synthetase
MPDLVPEQAARRQAIEEVMREVLAAYAYQEIRTPVIERTDLFQRSIGEVTDIVEKEMYSFDSRDGDSLTLRPEGTAGVVRAFLQHNLLERQQQRLWYSGPMFRYEKPQMGRQRQFHQLGVEAFGMDGPDIDAELILLCARLWRRLGIAARLTLELNSLGNAASREAHRAALVDYFEAHVDALDEDSRRRLGRNPLRILDSKNPALGELLAQAPSLQDYLDADSRAHFDGLRALLDEAGIEYRVNPRLVRGLDYYSLTVFEWLTDDLGAQGAVCAGGRYDGLIAQLGGRPLPAIGFAIGYERLQMLVELETDGAAAGGADVYCIAAGEAAGRELLRLAEAVRDALPGCRVLCHCGGGSLKSQMKRADRSGAELALLLGEDELQRNEVTVRLLRGEGQRRVAREALAAELGQLLAASEVGQERSGGAA